MKTRRHRFLGLTLVLFLLAGCSNGPAAKAVATSSGTGETSRFDIHQLGETTQIKAAGLQLMDLPIGMHELYETESSNDSILIVLVHGYDSRGYEWVPGIKGLVERFGSVFFYRYEWEQCPQGIAADLAQQISALQRKGNYRESIVFGHSYGGLILGFAASELGRAPIEVNIIAAPLGGFPRLLDHCDALQYNDQDKLVYPPWKPSVKVIQHRTVHAQDGAFRDLAVDPQDINLPFSAINQLPPTMDGHRLGHNWSVTWVIDNFLGRPHRY